MRIEKSLHIVFIMLTSLMLFACSTGVSKVSPELMTASMNEYRLNTGDKIKVTVFGEDELSGTYTINRMGRVALPLISDVDLGDKTVQQAENIIIENYSKDYLKDPKITVQIAQYRPFYILGEVNQPGSYPYVDNMTVLNAVAYAGGFTYRANKNGIDIKRAINGQALKTYTGSIDTILLPGDVIEIDERLF